MAEKIKPTKEQFHDYQRIQFSGVTNMFAINTVCNLSYEGLERGHCLYIMDNYEALENEYGKYGKE